MFRKTLQVTTALALISIKPVLADVQGTKPINIPAQDLSAAIAQLGKDTGLQVGISDELAVGKTSTAVVGPMTPTSALRLLLAGTGLSVRPVGGDSAVVTQNLVSQNVSDDEFDLGTIVLQGELIDRTLQDSQTSAAVFTGEDLDQRSDTDFNSIANRTANVTTDGFNYNIRGISSAGPSGTGRGATITTTIDGSRVSNFSDQNLTTYSTWDLQQVEILRGPQSTQTGRNALAGSVTIRSQDPVYFREGKARFGYASDDTRQAAIAVNTPLLEDVLAFRFSGEVFKSDGFVDYPSVSSGNPGEFDRTTLRAGLRFDPSQNFSGVLKYTYVDEEAPLEQVDRATFPDFIDDANEPGGREKTLRGWNLEMGYDVSSTLRLESSTNLTDLDTLFAFDSDGGPADGGFAERYSENRAFEQEIRLRYQTDRINAVAGAFYTDIDSEDETSAVVPGSFLPLPFPVPPGAQIVAAGNSTTDTKNTAIFGEIEYSVTEAFRVIAGARYDVEEIESTFGGTASLIGVGPNPIPIPQPTEPPTETDFDAFLPKIGLVYDVDQNQTVGFTFQQGYRAGGRRTNLGTTPFFTYTFDPEFTDNYEVSYRSEWYDGNLIVNGNAFYTKWRDQQVTVAQSDNANDFIIDNSGSSELWGFELDVRVAPTSDLTVFANLGYVNTEFTDFVGSTGDFTGNEFPSAPEWTGALGAAYNFGNGWSAGGEVTYTASTFSGVDNDPANKNDAYWLANIRVSKAFDNGFIVSAYVDNVFDESFTFSQTATSVTPGQPREIGVFGQILF